MRLKKRLGIISYKYQWFSFKLMITNWNKMGWGDTSCEIKKEERETGRKRGGRVTTGHCIKSMRHSVLDSKTSPVSRKLSRPHMVLRVQALFLQPPTAWCIARSDFLGLSGIKCIRAVYYSLLKSKYPLTFQDNNFMHLYKCIMLSLLPHYFVKPFGEMGRRKLIKRKKFFLDFFKIADVLYKCRVLISFINWVIIHPHL